MSTPRLAERVRRIRPSPSTVARTRVSELRAAGRDIIDLTTGEPDFDTPAHIRAAATAAMERGETKYTAVNGTLALRQAICAKLRRENDVVYTPKQISVANGAKQVIFNALAATVGTGDEVIVPAPYWVSYPDMVLACDGRPVIVPGDEEAGFKITPTALERAITPRTRWLVLNSPCNPTGAAFSSGELRELADVLLRHPDVWLLTDDIYEHIRYTAGDLASALKVEPRFAERTLLVNGVSKTYAMTGWRIGYGAGPIALIEAMNTLQSQMSSCASSIGQAAALAALEGDQQFVRDNARVYQERRDRAVALLNAIPGLRCAAPDGAFYVYPNCAGIIGKRTPAGTAIETDFDFVMYLLEAEGVAVLDGAAYGVSPYVRMSIATAMASIEEGCRRIKRACAALH